MLGVSEQVQKSWQCRQQITTTPRQTTFGSFTAWLGRFLRALAPCSEWIVTQGSSPCRPTVWKAQHHSTRSPSLQKTPKVKKDQCKNLPSIFILICFANLKKKVLLIIYFVYIDITLHLFPLSDGPFNQWANTAVDKFNISCALASLARLSPNNWIRALKKCEWMNDKSHALVEPSEKILSSLLLCEITEMRSRNTKINTLVNSSPLLKQRCLQY